MPLTTNSRTGRTLHQSIISQFAKLDASLNLLTPDDEEALFDWLMTVGADVSQTARMFLCSSINPQHSDNKKVSTQENV